MMSTKFKSLSALFAFTVLLAVATSATAQVPTLPTCKTGGQPVTLVINTNTSSGWTVNGSPVTALSSSGWANVSPATWIGGSTAGTLTYEVKFNAPAMHGPMAVTAKWAADNCGISLQAGSNTPVLTGPCYSSPSPNGRDFMYFNHTTTANFSTSDNNNPNPSIKFVVANQPGTPAGLGGIFTITAQCVCK